jgi:YHS domain-containing protein
MKHRIQAIVATAALLLPVAALASPQEGGSQGGHMEHCQAASNTLDRTLAAIDQATQAGAVLKDQALTQARKQLAEAKGHLSHCMAGMDEMGAMAGMDHGSMNMGGTKQGVTEVTDPVCGMKVADPKTAPRSVYAGKAYYFCSKEDKDKFDKDPEAYLNKKGS